MRWWLQTRGRAVDYPQGILSPEAIALPAWWSGWWGAFRDATTPEEPMFIIETGREGWRFYATAMGTGRRDDKGRNIRASLLAVGSSREDRALGLLISSWFDGRLAAHFRELLPEPQIERWLNSAAPPEGIEDAIDELLFDLPAPVQTDEPQLGRGVWGGPARSAECRRSLVTQAMMCAQNGRHGLFCWLNLLETVEEARELTALRRADVTILLIEADEDADALAVIEEDPPPPNPTVAGPPRPQADAGLPSTRPALTTGVVVLLVSGVLALVYIFASLFVSTSRR